MTEDLVRQQAGGSKALTVCLPNDVSGVITRQGRQVYLSYAG